MIRAISVNRDGSLIKGSERNFTEKQWTDMNYMFGSKLRWARVKDEDAKSKKRVSRKKKDDAVNDTVNMDVAFTESAKETQKEIEEKIVEYLKENEDLTDENTNIE